MTRRYERIAGSLSVLARLDELDDPDLDAATLQRSIVEAIAFGLGAENCSLMFFDDARETLELKAVYSPLEEQAKTFEEGDWSGRAFRVGEGIVGKVAQTGVAVRIEDTQQDPVFVHDNANRMSVGSLMCFPIRIHDQIAGVINLSHTKPNVFSIESEHMMTLIAGRISRLLTNHRLHRQLHESEAHYRLLTENAGDAIVVFDREGVIVSANPAVEQLIGVSAKTFVRGGGRWEKHVHDDDRPRFREHCAEVLRDRFPLAIEYRLIDENRKTHEIEQHSARLLNADENVAGIVTIMRDLTQRKREEAEQRAFDAQIHRTQKLESLSILASGAAHDFNNLLVGVIANTEMTLDSLADDSPHRKRLIQIQGAAARAADLSKQLLAYAGKGQLSRQRMQLTMLIEEMKPLVASIVKRVELEYDLDPAMPTIEGDVTQVRQILMNLITNATEALGSDGGAIRVRTGVLADRAAFADDPLLIGDPGTGDYVYLEVSDNGSGMDEVTRNQIFDPFFTTKPKGRGVGLASVFGIIRGHGGLVRVDSELGEGTTFTVYLPLAPGAGETAGTAEEWRGSGIVLVADDDKTISTLAGQMLKLLGFDTILVGNGREAVEVFRERCDEICAVMLDSSMPVMDGGEALAELKKMRSDIPVICTSGSGDHSAMETLTRNESVTFLPKPYEITELRDKLRELLA